MGGEDPSECHNGTASGLDSCFSVHKSEITIKILTQPPLIYCEGTDKTVVFFQQQMLHSAQQVLTYMHSAKSHMYTFTIFVQGIGHSVCLTT